MLRSALRVTITGAIACIACGAADSFACERSARSLLIPPSEAATSTSTARFTLSTKGAFSVTRTLASEVPSTASSCSVVLQGKYTRRGRLSALQVLGTRSSTAQTVAFTTTRLPAVRADRVGRRTVQPALHVRVVTTCTDSGGVTVLTDTSPVVARFADCGFSRTEVSMDSFVSTLKRRLASSR